MCTDKAFGRPDCAPETTYDRVTAQMRGVERLQINSRVLTTGMPRWPLIEVVMGIPPNQGHNTLMFNPPSVDGVCLPLP